MTFLSLPGEMRQLIFSNLDSRDLNALALTCKFLFAEIKSSSSFNQDAQALVSPSMLLQLLHLSTVERLFDKKEIAWIRRLSRTISNDADQNPVFRSADLLKKFLTETTKAQQRFPFWRLSMQELHNARRIPTDLQRDYDREVLANKKNGVSTMAGFSGVCLLALSVILAMVTGIERHTSFWLFTIILTSSGSAGIAYSLAEYMFNLTLRSIILEHSIPRDYTTISHLPDMTEPLRSTFEDLFPDFVENGTPLCQMVTQFIQKNLFALLLRQKKTDVFSLPDADSLEIVIETEHRASAPSSSHWRHPFFSPPNMTEVKIVPGLFDDEQEGLPAPLSIPS